MLINARTLRRQLIWAELDSNATTPGDTALLIHPAKNLREGERYIVALRDLRGADGALLEPSPRLQALPRPHLDALERVRAAPPAHGVDLQAARQGRHRPPRPLPRLGLHGREREDPVGPPARDPRRRVRPARRPQARRPAGERRSPGFTLDKVTDFPPCGNDGCQPGEDDVIRRRVEGHVTVPCYLDQPGCPPGSRFRLGPDGLPRQTPGNTHEANFICNIPRSVGLGAPGAACRSTATACSAAPARSTASAACRSRASTGSCCAPPTGSGCRAATCRTRSRSSRTSRASPTLADRLQQGMVNFLFLGRAMIHPQGFAANAAFRDAGGLADRHAPALLLGRQPGRHRGRRAHRGGARLHALGADRAGDELQPAAHPQHRLRPVQGAALPVLSRRARRGRCCCR